MSGLLIRCRGFDPRTSHQGIHGLRSDPGPSLFARSTCSSRVRRRAAARLSCLASPAVSPFDFDRQIDLIGLLSPAPTNSTVALCFVHHFFKELRRVETSAVAAVITIACISGARAAPSMTVKDLGIVAGPTTKSTSATAASSEDRFKFFVGPNSNATHASTAGTCGRDRAFLSSVAQDGVAFWATSGLAGLAPIASRIALRADPAQGTIVYMIATDTCRLRPSATYTRALEGVSTRDSRYTVIVRSATVPEPETYALLPAIRAPRDLSHVDSRLSNAIRRGMNA